MWNYFRLIYLADKQIFLIEMPSEHFGRLSRDGVDLDADLLALASRLHLLVVGLYARDDAKFKELK